MDDNFNSYAEWLGLEVGDRKPNRYELLGLEPYESDGDAIAAAADRAMSRVRSFRPGSRVAQWADLLDELNSAKSCLSDGKKKDEYDDLLRAQPEPARPTQPALSTPVTSGEVNPWFPPGMGGNPNAGEASAAPETPAAASEDPVVAVGGGSGAPNPMAPVAAGPTPVSGTGVADQYAAPTAGTTVPTALPAGQAPGAIPVATPVMPASPAAASSPMAQPVPAAVVPTALPTAQSAVPMAQAVPVGQVPSAPAGGVVANPAGGDPYGATEGPMQSAGMAAAADTAMADLEQMVGGTVPASQPDAGMEPSIRPAAGPGKIAAKRAKQSSQAMVFVGVFGASVLLAVSWITYIVSKSPEISSAVDIELKGNQTSGANPVSGPPRQPEPRPDAQPGPDSGLAPRPEPERVPEQRPQPQPPQLQRPQPEPPQLQPPQPQRPQPERPQPEPVPQPVSVPVPQPTAEELAQLGSALAAAKTALGDRTFDRANVELATAERLAKLPEHKAMVERLALLRDHVIEFWNAVAEGMVGLDNAGELQVKNTYVAIVEASRARIVIRVAGQNRRYTRLQLPAGLAMAIAMNWFDESQPRNLLFQAAFLAVEPNAEPGDARSVWDRAAAAGVDVEGVMPVVDDRYDL